MCFLWLRVDEGGGRGRGGGGARCKAAAVRAQAAAAAEHARAELLETTPLGALPDADRYATSGEVAAAEQAARARESVAAADARLAVAEAEARAVSERAAQGRG